MQEQYRIASADVSCLVNKDLNAVLSDAGLKPERGVNLLETFAFATMFQSQSKYARFYQAAVRAIQPHIVAQTVRASTA